MAIIDNFKDCTTTSNIWTEEYSTEYCSTTCDDTAEEFTLDVNQTDCGVAIHTDINGTAYKGIKVRMKISPNSYSDYVQIGIAPLGESWSWSTSDVASDMSNRLRIAFRTSNYSNHFGLLERVGGSGTMLIDLDGEEPSDWTVYHTYTIKISDDGTEVEVFIDDISKGTATIDSTFADGGYVFVSAGYYNYNSNGPDTVTLDYVDDTTTPPPLLQGITKLNNELAPLNIIVWERNESGDPNFIGTTTSNASGEYSIEVSGEVLHDVFCEGSGEIFLLDSVTPVEQ